MSTKIKGRYRRPMRGTFPSLKMNKMIKFHSSVEYDFMYWLEYALQVTSYTAQEITIQYEHWDEKTQKWKKRRYTPDFFIVTSDGRKILVEIKAKRFINSSINQYKFNIARQWCAERNWKFIVLSEEDIRAAPWLENIKFLWRYARFQERPGLINHIHSILTSTESPLSVIELAKTLAPDDVEAMILPIYYLAFHHKLFIALGDGEVSFDSPVYLPNTREEKINELLLSK